MRACCPLILTLLIAGVATAADAGPFRVVRALAGTDPALAGARAIDGTAESAIPGAGATSAAGTIAATVFSGTTQAGTRAFGNVALAASADRNFEVSLLDFDIRDVTASATGFASVRRTQQDCHLRLAWLADGTLPADGAGFALVSPATANAVVLDVAVRFDAYGHPMYQLTDYGGSPVASGLWQVAAGTTIAQAQSDVANRLADLGPILRQLPLGTVHPAFTLQSSAAGGWALSLDADADGVIDVDWLSTQVGNRPCSLPGGVPQAGGVRAALAPAGGARRNASVVTTASLRYRERLVESIPVPRDSRFQATAIPAASEVNPAYLEGRTWLPDLGVIAQVGASAAAVARLDAHDFYFQVPLAAAAPTPVRLTEATGLSLSGAIAWTPIALLGEAARIIPANTSLLFEGSASGTWRILRESGIERALAAIAPGQRVAYTFTTPGIYTVEAFDQEDRRVASIAVTAVGADLPAGLACEINFERTVAVRVSPAWAAVTFAGDPVGATVVTTGTRSDGVVTLAIKPTVAGGRMVARLGGSSGRIIADQRLATFAISTNAMSFISTEALSDGSMAGDAVFTMHPLLAGLELRAHVFVAGVTFADGNLDLIAPSAAFASVADGDGALPYRLIAAPGVEKFCHSFQVFQAGVAVSR